MYRDEALSMARKIEHLESELADYRALGARRRQRVVVGVSVVSTAIAVFAGLMWRCEAMHTEYLTGALAKTRAELAEAEARECRSGIVSSRPSQKNAGLSGP